MMPKRRSSNGASGSSSCDIQTSSLERFASLNDSMLHRAGAILALAEAAAATDYELARERDRGREAQRRHCNQLAHELRYRVLLPAVRADEATDILVALCSESIYLRLTAERSWSPERYRSWLERTLRRTPTSLPGD